MIYLNKALSEYGTGEVVPAYYVLFTACAVLGSAILYSDLDDSNMNSLATLVGAFLATSLGVYLVSHGKGRPEGGIERGPSLDGRATDGDMEALL